MADLEVPGYRIVRSLGEGAMASVYLARQHSLGRDVAIKVLHAEHVQDPAALAQFRLEAHSVANLKHPNILQMYEAGEVDGIPYVVMEFVSGGSIESWAAKADRISKSDALAVAVATAEALRYAWEHAGLVHCDIKPDNLLLDGDGTVKVADFSGISRDGRSPDARLVAGLIIGTPGYMAPEQAQGIEDPDHRADIYALGAVLYRLLTGTAPFAGVPCGEVLRLAHSARLSDPRRSAPGIGPHIVRLIERMMAIDRNHRHPDWKAVLDDLALLRSGRAPAGAPLPDGASTVQRDPETHGPMTSVSARPGAATGRSVRPPARSPVALWAVILVLLFSTAGLLIALRRDAVQPSPIAVSMPLPDAQEPEADPDPSPEVSTADEAVHEVPDSEHEEDSSSAEEDVATHYHAMAEAHRPALGLARRLRFAEAETMLREWARDNPANLHVDEALRSADRLRRASELTRVLVDNAERLRDRELPFLPAGTRVMGVDPDALRVRRRLEAGTMDWAVSFDQIPGRDMLGLLAAADPDAAPLHGAVYSLAQAHFPEALRMMERAERMALDTGDLRAWHGSWEKLALALVSPQAPVPVSTGEAPDAVSEDEPVEAVPAEAGEAVLIAQGPPMSSLAEREIRTAFASGRNPVGGGGYPGRAGGGWASGWQTREPGSVISVASSDLLDEGGASLRVEVPPGVREVHLYRMLDPNRPVDLGAPHAIRFSLRVDNAQAFSRHRGDGATAIRIVNADTPNPNHSQHTWWIGAFTNMRDGNWRVRTFDQDSTVFADTGIRPMEGVTYTFEIRVFPSESRYSVTLTDSRRGRWNSDRQYREPLLFRGTPPLDRAGYCLLFNVQKASDAQTIGMGLGISLGEIRIWNIDP